MKQLKINGPLYGRHNVSISFTTKARQQPTGSLSNFFLFIFSALFLCTDDYCNQQPIFHLKLITFIAISALYCVYLRTLLFALYVQIAVCLPKMENLRGKWTIFYKDLYSFHFYQILLGLSNKEI